MVYPMSTQQIPKEPYICAYILTNTPCRKFALLSTPDPVENMDRSFTEGMKYSQPGSPPYKLYQIADEDDASGVGEQAIQHQPKQL